MENLLGKRVKIIRPFSSNCECLRSVVGSKGTIIRYESFSDVTGSIRIDVKLDNCLCNRAACHRSRLANEKEPLGSLEDYIELIEDKNKADKQSRFGRLDLE